MSTVTRTQTTALCSVSVSLRIPRHHASLQALLSLHPFTSPLRRCFSVFPLCLLLSFPPCPSCFPLVAGGPRWSRESSLFSCPFLPPHALLLFFLPCAHIALPVPLLHTSSLCHGVLSWRLGLGLPLSSSSLVLSSHPPQKMCPQRPDQNLQAQDQVRRLQQLLLRVSLLQIQGEDRSCLSPVGWS